MNQTNEKAKKWAGLIILAGVVLALFSIGFKNCGHPGFNKQNSDIEIMDVKTGDGAEAKVGQMASIHYHMYVVKNGKVSIPSLDDKTFMGNEGKDLTLIDKSDGRKPTEDFLIHLGTAQVVAGWDKGIQGMKVHGQRRVFIPSNLAYGPNGIKSSDSSGKELPPDQWRIPPNNPIVLDIELESVAEYVPPTMTKAEEAALSAATKQTQAPKSHKK